MPQRKKRQAPKVGSTYTKHFKGANHTMTVVEASEGFGYKVGKTTYRTPTAAAKSITDTEVNGWVFWNIEK